MHHNNGITGKSDKIVRWKDLLNICNTSHNDTAQISRDEDRFFCTGFYSDMKLQGFQTFIIGIL